MANHNPTDIEEIWKLVPSFPDYEASSLGRLRRCVGKSGAQLGRILTPVKHTSGYLFYCLRKPTHPGRRFNVYAHIPIAEAFFGPKLEGFEVNHKNGQKTDNRIDNLEYVTSSENQRHAFRMGLQQRPLGEKANAAKLTTQDVLTIRALLANGVKQDVIAERYHLTQQTVSCIKLRKSWKHI